MGVVNALGTTWPQSLQASSTIGSLFYGAAYTRHAVSSGPLYRPDIWVISNLTNNPSTYGLTLGRTQYLTDIIIGDGNIKDSNGSTADFGTGIPQSPYIRFPGYPVGVLTSNATGELSSVQTFSISGNITALDFILSSDIALKKNIKPIEDLSKFDNIKWVNFEMKNDFSNRLRAGVIAQDVEKYAPEFVYIDEMGFKSVAYTDLLCSKIASLEIKIQELEKLIKK
jgi:hypothetical protein